MSDAEGMWSAEAAEPGFVFRNGWTHLGCPRCEEVIYDGRQIGAADTNELIRIHETSCGESKL